MSVVRVDERGRLTLPKKTGIRNTRVAVIPAGSFVVLIPIPPKPSKYAKDWLDTDKGRKELKKLAEDLARKDAVERAKRRNQL